MKNLDWWIGKEGTMAANMENPPFRAFFRVYEDGEIIDSFDLSESELETEIERRSKNDEMVDGLKNALRDLRQHNR